MRVKTRDGKNRVHLEAAELRDIERVLAMVAPLVALGLASEALLKELQAFNVTIAGDGVLEQ